MKKKQLKKYHNKRKNKSVITLIMMEKNVKKKDN